MMYYFEDEWGADVTATNQGTHLVVMVCLLGFASCGDKPAKKVLDFGKNLPVHSSFVTAREFETYGLRWLENSQTGISMTTSVPTGMLDKPVVTILVHGYKTPAQKVIGYFEELVAYLRADAGLNHSLVVFDWPSEGRHWVELSNLEQLAYIEFLMSTVGEKTGGRIPGLGPEFRWESNQYFEDKSRAAKAGAPALLKLIDQIAGPNKSTSIMIIAHSMGCFVVAEALGQKRESVKFIKRMVFLAPDLDKFALHGDAFRSIQLESMDVYYSRNDGVLSVASRLANFGFSRLGAYGPSSYDGLPSYIRIHDVTQVLGEVDVHNAYLTRKVATAIQLASRLKSP